MTSQAQSEIVGSNHKIVGILNIIAGAIFFLPGLGISLSLPLLGPMYGFTGMYFILMRIDISIVLGLMAIVGGIYALRRKIWGLVLVGSISNMLLGPLGLWWFIGGLSLLFTILLGLPAVLLTFQGKREFEGEKSWAHSAVFMLNLVAGANGLILGIPTIVVVEWLVMEYDLSQTNNNIIIIIGVLTIVFGLIALLGGINAARKKRWGLVLVGSICSLFLGLLPGIPAITFTIIGKRDFED